MVFSGLIDQDYPGYRLYDKSESSTSFAVILERIV